MRPERPIPILAGCPTDMFVGRSDELEHIDGHISRTAGDACLPLLAAPGAGVSELLRQAYDRAFFDGSGPIPFYFEITDSDRTVRAMATRFLQEFLRQTVAFRRRDPAIITASPDMCEVTELAVPADGYWIDRLAETCEGGLTDDRSFIRNCLSAPIRAARHGAISFVMIDRIHRLASMDGGEAVISELRDIYSRARIRSVLAGHRRFVFERFPFPSLQAEPLAYDHAAALVEKLAQKNGIKLTDASRDLIAVELDGVPGHIHRLFATAAERGADLDTFESVQQIYVDEIFGGRIATGYGHLFDRIIPDNVVQARVIRVLDEAALQPEARVSLAYFQKHAGIEKAGLDALHQHEIVDVEGLSVRFETTNAVLADYVRARARLEGGESRALVVGEALTTAIKQAPAKMARVYRRDAAIGVADLLDSFNSQMVTLALFDYGRYKAEFKGAGDDKIVKALREDNDKVALPRIVYVTTVEAVYPMFAAIAEPERAAVGIGLENDGREIAVLAAEIDSKLEAKLDVAEYWCDRLEAAAIHSNFANFKIWLIAPEGFDAAAIEMLRRRGFYGSSRKQAALLAEFLNTEVAAKPVTVPDLEPMPMPEPPPTISPTPEPLVEDRTIPSGASEISGVERREMTISMDGDTEMVAARAVEDLARQHGVPQKAINQVKTALVEACINASEHSLSPDRKIDLTFAVGNGRIEVTVTNRGLRLADTQAAAANDDDRRGWGLKLMRSLMDDVRIEPTDDGTRIVMAKSFVPE
ncbi:MAG: ATP-binding protein [Chloracidobacterium sp.]|nr:ATP-binding protein [Chloracidobacterium sp.]